MFPLTGIHGIQNVLCPIRLDSLLFGGMEFTVPMFSSVMDRVIGSKKDIGPNWSSSEDIWTAGRASFSRRSNWRRTREWMSWYFSGIIASRQIS